MTICTPSWVAEQVASEGWVWGFSLLILPTWDVALMRTAVARLCAKMRGDSHGERAGALAHYLKWEADWFVNRRMTERV